MKIEIDIKQIVSTYHLCISENPYGIKRLWPNSYIEKFYNEFFNHIYIKNKSPKILEINQSNHNNIILWSKCFKNSQIDNYKNKDIKNSIKFKYDVIIISDKNTLEEFNSITKLIVILNHDGTIVFENVGRDLEFIIKLFLKYFINYNLFIMDYRLHRFRLNNCILTIKKSRKQFALVKKFLSVLSLIKFIISETMISLLVKFIKN